MKNTGLNKVFVDSDCLLDLLLKREPFVNDTQDLLFAAHKQKLKLTTSALVISNINYILSKALKNKTAVKKHIALLVKMLEILTVDSSNILIALESEFNDFEDAIQNNVAEVNHCDFLITRNVSDYRRSKLRVLTPKQFLRTVLK